MALAARGAWAGCGGQGRCGCRLGRPGCGYRYADGGPRVPVLIADTGAGMTMTNGVLPGGCTERGIRLVHLVSRSEPTVCRSPANAVHSEVSLSELNDAVRRDNM